MADQNEYIVLTDEVTPNIGVPSGTGLGFDPVSLYNGANFVPPDATDLRAAEIAIVTQLQANLSPTIRCEAFPDNWETYRKTNMNGYVLARFVAADYARERPTDIVAQWRVMHWEMLVMARVLGWGFGGQGDQFVGAYSLIEGVRLALTGFQIPGFKKAYAVRDNFIDYEQGWWIYGCEYAFETLAVEQPVQVGYPLFIKGQIFEQGGVTPVAVVTQAAFAANGQLDAGHQNLANVIVSNPTTNQVYGLGTDYTVDAVNGIIYQGGNSRIPPGGTVNLAYQYSDVTIASAYGGTAPFAPSN